MSASFYRHHDQWLAMQGGGVTGAHRDPNLQTLKSHRSSRDSARRHNLKTEEAAAEATVPYKTELEKRKERLLGPDKIVSDAMQANKQVQDLRKSLQSLPNTALQPSRRDDALRRSGTGTTGYQRP